MPSTEHGERSSGCRWRQYSPNRAGQLWDGHSERPCVELAIKTLTAVVSTYLLVGTQSLARAAPRSRMKLVAIVVVAWLLLAMPIGASASGQWNPQKSNTTASLHGLSIVNANVVWASGTGGTFVRTTDRGETWQAGTVPGGERLDFRNVYAVDAKTAYLMSIGNGNESRIYKTTDAGKAWSLQYTEANPKAFLDCMAFWNAERGIVVGDSIDGQPELLTTLDGGG